MSAAKRRWGRLPAMAVIMLMIGGGGMAIAATANAAVVGMNSFQIYMDQGETKTFDLESQFSGDGTRLSRIVSTTANGLSPKIGELTAKENSITITTPVWADAATTGMSWTVEAEVIDSSSKTAINSFKIIVWPFNCPAQYHYRGPVVAGETGTVDVRSQCDWNSAYVPGQLGILGATTPSVVPQSLSMRGLSVTHNAPTNPVKVGELAVDATSLTLTAGPDIVTYEYTDTIGRTASAKATFFVNGPAAQLNRDVPVAFGGVASIPVTDLTGLPDEGFGPDCSFVTSIDTKASTGSVTVGEDGSLQYSAQPGWSGTELVTVSTKWRTGITVIPEVVAQTVVRFTVAAAPLAPAPVANDISITMNQGEIANIDVLASATGEGLAVGSITTPASGTATLASASAGIVAYSPEPTFAGLDSFEVTVVDSTGRTATMTVHLTVVAAATVVAPTPAPPVVAGSGVANTGPAVAVLPTIAVALGLVMLGVILLHRRSAKG